MTDDILDRAQKLLTAVGSNSRWVCLFDSEQALITIYELADTLRSARAEIERLRADNQRLREANFKPHNRYQKG